MDSSNSNEITADKQVYEWVETLVKERYPKKSGKDYENKVEETYNDFVNFATERILSSLDKESSDEVDKAAEEGNQKKILAILKQNISNEGVKEVLESFQLKSPKLKS